MLKRGNPSEIPCPSGEVFLVIIKKGSIHSGAVTQGDVIWGSCEMTPMNFTNSEILPPFFPV